MSKTLLLVESPTKAKKLQGYLGSNYIVQATFGHVMDLPQKELGVDLNTLEESYVVLDGKGRIDYDQLLKRLSLLSKEATKVILASDPDREGEAIAWHLQRYLKLKNDQYERIELREITKKGVEDALKKSRKINADDVSAQRARRVLDRLMGYGISPVLMRAVDNARSAGRVQSAALRLIVERDRENERFKPEDRYSVEGQFSQQGVDYKGRLLETNSVYDYAQPLDGAEDTDADDVDTSTTSKKKKKKFVSDQNVDALVAAIKEISDSEWSVISIEEHPTEVSPKPPLITSTLQQLGSRRFGFSGDHTMAIAQKLFESGYITYMRTDSVRVAEEAQTEAREYLAKEYGSDMVPAVPNVYKTNSAAQDGHEAIRPTDVTVLPTSISIEEDKAVNQVDAKLLYEAIREIFLCSQAASGKNSVTTAITEDTDARFQFESTSTVWLFPGWRAISQEESKGGTQLKVKQGQSTLTNVIANHTQTKPKPRYREDTLNKDLEKYGVGRPSSYATITKTLIQRGYVGVKARELISTDLGRSANDWLMERAGHYTDVHYTAKVEERLDAIASGKEDKMSLMSEIRDDLKKYFNAFQERGSGAPSIKQKELLDNIKARGVNVPDTAYATMGGAKEFLDQYMSSRGPSEKQVEFALQLAQATGMDYTDDMRMSAVKTKEFLDKAMAHAQKNNIRVGGGSDRAASPKQIEMAKKLASEQGIEWDTALEGSMQKISAFIDERMKNSSRAPSSGPKEDRPATEKQIGMAEKLALRLGIEYPKSYRNSMQKTSAFIDKHMKK